MGTSSDMASLADVAALSTQARRLIVTLGHRARNGHLGSALSAVDILTTLYFAFLRIDPKNPKDPARDRFILSKGHGCAALYSTLALRGFFRQEELMEKFLKDDGGFPGHPSSHLVPGVEASTGSLGHGLSIATGIALAHQRDGSASRTVVVLSDGECDEGSTWEAAMSAGFWKLDSLFCIVDYNHIQSFGRVSDVLELEPFADKWRSFGWHVQEIDGHDHAAILEALNRATSTPGRPHLLLAHTVKGKGVSFMENTIDWHYWPPNDEQLAQALSELTLP